LELSRPLPGPPPVAPPAVRLFRGRLGIPPAVTPVVPPPVLVLPPLAWAPPAVVPPPRSPPLVVPLPGAVDGAVGEEVGVVVWPSVVAAIDGVLALVVPLVVPAAAATRGSAMPELGNPSVPVFPPADSTRWLPRALTTMSPNCSGSASRPRVSMGSWNGWD